MKLIPLLLSLLIGVALGYFLKPSPPARTPSPIRIDCFPSPDTLSGLAKVTGRHFTLAEVIAASTEVVILEANPTHAPLLSAIAAAGLKVSQLMSQPDSPARSKRRINEVSALFEDALRQELDRHPDLSCDFPKTNEGKTQRSGYPDLRIEHLPSGTIAYLDPKLFEAKSLKSSFRSFYYEPGGANSKVTEDALHLLLGFPHDGQTRRWTFDQPHLVDLSKLTVRLKTEFSASNKDLYSPYLKETNQKN